MLCYPMLWYGMERIVCYDISMQCYAMVYVVKDKHSATVDIEAVGRGNSCSSSSSSNSSSCSIRIVIIVVVLVVVVVTDLYYKYHFLCINFL